MRVESDRQGHHGSEAPACHHCGFPLLEETTFCPYCERWLDDGQPSPAGGSAIRRQITERALYTAGFVFFAVVAIVCIAIALLV